MTKLFARRGLFIALSILGFLSFLGQSLMSEASERSSDNTVIVPSQCAVAFAHAIDDFGNWFSSHPQQGYPGFKEYFEEKYGSVKCSDEDDKILVYFYPKEPGTRGGGIKYLIDKNSYAIIERVFDR